MTYVALEDLNIRSLCLHIPKSGWWVRKQTLWYQGACALCHYSRSLGAGTLTSVLYWHRFDCRKNQALEDCSSSSAHSHDPVTAAQPQLPPPAVPSAPSVLLAASATNCRFQLQTQRLRLAWGKRGVFFPQQKPLSTVPTKGSSALARWGEEGIWENFWKRWVWWEKIRWEWKTFLVEGRCAVHVGLGEPGPPSSSPVNLV